jgi:hypothetical protein
VHISPPDEVDFVSNLAEEYQTMADNNHDGLKRMRKYYAAFVAVGFFQLVLWTAVAWING